MKCHLPLYKRHLIIRDKFSRPHRERSRGHNERSDRLLTIIFLKISPKFKLLEKQPFSNNTSFPLPKMDSPPLETKNNLVEDPFDKKEEEENIPAIPAQIKKPPNINNLEENQLKLNNKKSSLSRITKKEQQPNGGEKHFEEDYNIFRRKNKLREDLVFKREEGEENKQKLYPEENKNVKEEEKEEEEYVGK